VKIFIHDGPVLPWPGKTSLENKKPSYHHKSGNPARLKAPWFSVPTLQWVWLYLHAILTNFYNYIVSFVNMANCRIAGD
jgi:hypothetical protein